MTIAARMLGCAILAITVGCAGLFCVACDGLLAAEGIVYRAPPGAAAVILVDAESEQPLPGTEPVSDCGVTLEPYSETMRPKPDTAKLWTSHGVTGAGGRFTLGGTARPGRYDATIVVECPAYAPLRRVFQHGRQLRHRVVAFVQPQS